MASEAGWCPAIRRVRVAEIGEKWGRRLAGARGVRAASEEACACNAGRVRRRAWVRWAGGRERFSKGRASDVVG